MARLLLERTKKNSFRPVSTHQDGKVGNFLFLNGERSPGREGKEKNNN